MDVIERVEDQDRAIIHNSIKYLDSLSKISQLNTPTLKSLYRTKCRLMELRWKASLTKQSLYQRCQKCFMNFSEGNTKCEVRMVKLTQFAKKVIAKAKKGTPLTSFQRIYYKKIKKKYPHGFNKQNKMVFTCQFCQEECIVFMNKPEAPKKPKRAITPAKVKKPKKKDKFCGLNESLVILSSKKKQKKATTADNTTSDQSNNNINLNNTNNVFIPTQVNNFEVSVSIADTRGFGDDEIVKGAVKKRQTVKMATKKENVAITTTQKVPKVITKSQKKSNNNLAQMLKKVGEHKGSPQSRLKDFLSSL